MNSPITDIKPFYQPSPTAEPAPIQTTIRTLNLRPHIEGGYFAETDRDPHQEIRKGSEDSSNSTTIYYFLTPRSPLSAFHRNRSRTVHTLHRGRGQYVIIHADQADENGGKAPISSFVVGHDLEKGEKLQWVVEGGDFKASYLLPDGDDGKSESGLLISETVVPGFEYEDHDFMRAETMDQLLTSEQSRELKWMLRKG